MKPTGKFYLVTRTRSGSTYYRESGVFDVGTPYEEMYLYWTRNQDKAYGFRTIKQARRMADILWEEYGYRVYIVDRNGVEVC